MDYTCMGSATVEMDCSAYFRSSSEFSEVNVMEKNSQTTSMLVSMVRSPILNSSLYISCPINMAIR